MFKVGLSGAVVEFKQLVKHVFVCHTCACMLSACMQALLHVRALRIITVQKITVAREFLCIHYHVLFTDNLFCYL